MIQPPYLKQGDKVALVATARKVSKEEMQPAIDQLSSWGLEVVCGEHLFASDHQFAGNDAQRSADLQAAINDPSIAAILCARGGYGTVRLLDRVDFNVLCQQPKWLIGYSDVTALHLHLQTVLGIMSIHGAMPLDFPADGSPHVNTTSLKKALFGEPLTYRIDGNSLNRQGEAKGQLIGGNLSMVYSLAGSAAFPSGVGKVLFLEDLDEYLYHIDRMMMNLKRTGLLQEINALVIGGMSKMNDNAIPYGKTAEEIIHEAVADYDYPVCFGFPAGHLPENNALRFGQEVRLNVQKDQLTLTF